MPYIRHIHAYNRSATCGTRTPRLWPSPTILPEQYSLTIPMHCIIIDVCLPALLLSFMVRQARKLLASRSPVPQEVLLRVASRGIGQDSKLYRQPVDVVHDIFVLHYTRRGQRLEAGSFASYCEQRSTKSLPSTRLWRNCAGDIRYK